MQNAAAASLLTAVNDGMVLATIAWLEITVATILLLAASRRGWAVVSFFTGLIVAIVLHLGIAGGMALAEGLEGLLAGIQTVAFMFLGLFEDAFNVLWTTTSLDMIIGYLAGAILFGLLWYRFQQRLARRVLVKTLVVAILAYLVGVGSGALWSAMTVR